MKRIRRLLHELKTDQAGLSLPEVMVAVIINTISVSVIAGSILAFMTLQTAFTGSASAARESSVTELRWRSDLRESVKMTPLNATSVTFSLAGSAGSCLERNWVFAPRGAKSALQIVTREYSGVPRASGCSGTSGVPTTSTVVEDSGPASAFTFSNAGGRTITFAAGVAQLDTSAVKPPAVTDFDWADTTVSLAALNTATRGSTTHRQPLVVAQSLAKQAASSAVADAPMRYVAP